MEGLNERRWPKSQHRQQQRTGPHHLLRVAVRFGEISSMNRGERDKGGSPVGAKNEAICTDLQLVSWQVPPFASARQSRFEASTPRL